MALAYKSLLQNAHATYKVGGAYPIDERVVVETLNDLLLLCKGTLIRDTSTNEKVFAYVGMPVFVEEDSNFYVCVKKAKKGVTITSYEQAWKRITDNVSMIFDTKKSLTDGSILFPFQGMLAYVNEERTLYVLTSNGIENSKVEDNWKPIGGGNFNIKEYLNFNAKPTSGSGFKIEDGTTIISSYINNTHEFEKGVFYTSQGMNSYGDVPEYVVNYNYIDLSNGGESYIRLFTSGDNWIEFSLTDDSLGITAESISVKNQNGEIEPYNVGNAIPKGCSISFNKDFSFKNLTETRDGDDNTYTFGLTGNNYETVDIYKEDILPQVYAYKDNNEVRLLTEDDLDNIDNKISQVEDRIDNIADSIMVDPDGDGSEEANSLQTVIYNMNKAITKLEQMEVPSEIETITESEIKSLF